MKLFHDVTNRDVVKVCLIFFNLMVLTDLFKFLNYVIEITY